MAIVSIAEPSMKMPTRVVCSFCHKTLILPSNAEFEGSSKNVQATHLALNYLDKPSASGCMVKLDTWLVREGLRTLSRASP